MTRETPARLLTVGILALGLAVVGCASTPDAEPEAPDTGSEWAEAPVPVPEPSPERTPVRSLSVELQTVYFDLDRSDIRSDARPTLRSNADGIEGLPGQVTLEGNCDERGSQEYNLALGERRANAVKRYLVDLGVSSSRLRTVSFGEDRPAVQGHDESAWRYNRRVDFVVGR